MIEVIPLKYGTMFKRAFSQPDVFRQFVCDILGIQINIDKVHTEYEYQGRAADARRDTKSRFVQKFINKTENV